jgi:hypothetical protein
MPKKRKNDYSWRNFSDEELLDLRLKDLKLKIEGTTLERRTNRLSDELNGKGFVFRPHFWLSNEWFAPEETPGIALPFYLVHPRLMKLERRQIFEVEGGNEASCMRLLRHETGHAIDTAYQLFRRKKYRNIFGVASKKYPTHYTPKPYSNKYVLHLDLWYAQVHPVEDFAETFAVWMSGERRWRNRYKGWPALKKLEYVDELMAEVVGEKPKNATRTKVEPLSTLRMTLREHYRLKRERYGLENKGFYDHELLRLFPEIPVEQSITAGSFLRRHRKELRTLVSNWTGQPAFIIDQIIQELIERSRQLKLRASLDADNQFRNVLSMVCVQVTNSLLSERRSIPI